MRISGPLFAQGWSTARIFIQEMDDSLQRLQAKIARQIAESEALRVATNQGDLALVDLEQDLAAWKRMALRLAHITVYEP
jgi:hypothetical protein